MIGFACLMAGAGIGLLIGLAFRPDADRIDARRRSSLVPVTPALPVAQVAVATKFRRSRKSAR